VLPRLGSEHQMVKYSITIAFNYPLPQPVLAAAGLGAALSRRSPVDATGAAQVSTRPGGVQVSTRPGGVQVSTRPGAAQAQTG